MKTKGHGTIKKSKAYGAIGTLLLSGVLVAAMEQQLCKLTKR